MTNNAFCSNQNDYKNTLFDERRYYLTDNTFFIKDKYSSYLTKLCQLSKNTFSFDTNFSLIYREMPDSYKGMHQA